ncbi:uncharacterized protein LOC126737773 [Anthonomus grandis grandis]|uniref:uncharacterized protein LOC126737773 n=1 Tax=Anthonomus grandis grandis TaxID=2921223 RepID=UPI00216599F1|nr:uncharacterized protein LOC126737773 [Anthonomus grandis grandis]
MENNRHFWTEFIEIYQEHSCLWDVRSNDYSNKHKRNASYEILLRKLKEINPTATMELLKKKINNMRTAFRRELKKVQDSKGTGIGTDDLYEPTLWYYDLLLFTSQSESGRKGRAIDEDEVSESNNTINADDNSEYEIRFSSSPPLYSPLNLGSQGPSAEEKTTSTPLSSTTLSCRTIAKYQKRTVSKTINESELKNSV